MVDLDEWKTTLIAVAVSIAINLTLPIWLRLAKLCDDNLCTKTRSEIPDINESEDGDDYTGGGRHPCESSVVSDSKYSSLSSTVIAPLNAVLDARPRRTAGRPAHRQRRRRDRDVRYAAELTKLSFEESGIEVEHNIFFGDSCAGKSVMSKVSIDDISLNECSVGGEPVTKNMYSTVDIAPKISCWEKLLELSEWESSLTSLAGFYMIQGIIETATEIVEVALISHMIGITEGNAFMMVNFLFETSGVFSVGYQEALSVLVPQAEGAGNDLLVGRYLQIVFIFSFLCQIPGFVLWSFYMYDIMLWFNFDELTAEIAQQYTYSIFLYWIAETVNECLLEFLDVTDREKYVTIFAVVQAFISSGTIVAMSTLGVSNMVAIGLAQSFVRITIMFVNFLIVSKKGWFDHVSEGLVKTFGLKDFRAMWTTFITAIPLGVSWILSFGEWSVMIVFAQWIGSDEVAAWNFLGYIWDFFESVTEAVASAAEVRVGFRMGAGKPQLAKKMSEKSIYFGTLCAIYTAGTLFVLAEFLPSWLTPNLVYQKLVFDQLPLIGFGGILMVPGMVMESILNAQGRVRLMTMIEIISSWFIVIPIAAILVYLFDFGLEGMVIGLVVGYSTLSTICFFFIIRSNWEQLSKRVIKQNCAEGTRYLDTNWDELPSEIREAASTLGYNKILWESGDEPASTEKAWNNLTKVEKKAAGVLGYNKKKWNGEDDKGNGYEEYDFDDLPPEVRKAAKFLGYTSSVWDNDGKIPIEKKDWASLTPEQQDAATTLGYTEIKWNDDDSDSSSSSPDSSIHGDSSMPPIPENKEVNYDSCDFRKLPIEVQRAAKFLGYTAAIWDNDGKVPIESKDWRKLSAEQQKAASTLGYNEEKWDNESDSSSSSSDDSKPCTGTKSIIAKNMNRHDCNFDKLPEDAKNAAKVLGYNSSTWDSGGQIPIAGKEWSDLTTKERDAAVVLGMTEAKWAKNPYFETSQTGCIPLEFCASVETFATIYSSNQTEF